MFLSIGMLKLNYFLADIFILSAEKQPIKLSWRKIEWLRDKHRIKRREKFFYSFPFIKGNPSLVCQPHLYFFSGDFSLMASP